MALGEHIGYGTRLTQNNRLLYSVGNGIESGSANQIHIALLGDPTLRLHVVKPVSDLTLGSGGGSVSLSWSASPDQVLGYHVYRAASIDSAFARLTDSAIVATAFTDSEPPRGVNTYMVRALKLEQSASGSYYNLSTGIMDSVETNLGIADGDGGLPTGKLRMNFLSGGRSIVLSATAGHVGHAMVRVLDLAGRNVRSATVRLQGRGHYRALDMRNLPAGVYVVAVELHDIAQRSRITLR